jgi:hypothetical protein
MQPSDQVSVCCDNTTSEVTPAEIVNNLNNVTKVCVFSDIIKFMWKEGA